MRAIMKRKKKPEWQFPPEVEAVLRAPPTSAPANQSTGASHTRNSSSIRGDRCEKCRAFVIQLDKESEMMSYLRNHKN